jgi:hypothetical protein
MRNSEGFKQQKQRQPSERSSDVSEPPKKTPSVPSISNE